MEGFMNYDVEMGSGSMKYIPSFRKIGSSIQKFIKWDTHTDSKVISEALFYYFKIRKVD
jgi:hypothetical protein